MPGFRAMLELHRRGVRVGHGRRDGPSVEACDLRIDVAVHVHADEIALVEVLTERREMRRGEMPGERLLGVPLLEDSEPARHIGVCPEAIGATPWLLQRLGSQCASTLDHAVMDRWAEGHDTRDDDHAAGPFPLAAIWARWSTHFWCSRRIAGRRYGLDKRDRRPRWVSSVWMSVPPASSVRIHAWWPREPRP